MGSTLLSDFEQQYSVQTAEITSRIGGLCNLDKSEVASGIQNVQRLLVDVENLLEQMELTVRDIDSTSPDRSKYELRVKSYRNDKKQLEVELKRAIQRIKEGTDREELLNIDNGISIDQQDQLIENTLRLERTSRRLQDTYRMVVETEQIGAEVLDDLSTQHETLSRARDRMRSADVDLNRSQMVLSTMIRRLVGLLYKRFCFLLIRNSIFLLFYTTI
uniref:t-SNARE coiled-coil homology domain-containing protein n=1 Tax=Syphacia muris TaxID=451379 RepID=A0A0N5B0U6_9BILA